MWKRLAAVLLAALAPAALGAAPRHIETADYFAGYAGTHAVAPQAAAPWLDWAETDIKGSLALRAVGVKTMLYTDPNRTMSGDQEFSSNESTFAHTCLNQRIATSRSGQFLMDPHSPALEARWSGHVSRYSADGRFDAIFEDDADDVAYVKGTPCRYDANDWLSATAAMQKALGYPVIYNGLSNFNDASVSGAIGLNASSIGGMMEQCYAASPGEPKTSGDRWRVTEATEIQMAAQGKLFFCYGNDTTAPAQAAGGRLYVLASFLLTYDVARSVLWELYGGTAQFHVMPETQIVPTAPSSPVTNVDQLRTQTGVYRRDYAACYAAGRLAGPCAIAVNPDPSPHAVDLHGYTRTLQISGGGVFDGGSALVVSRTPPVQLDGLSAVIAFR